MLGVCPWHPLTDDTDAQEFHKERERLTAEAQRMTHEWNDIQKVLISEKATATSAARALDETKKVGRLGLGGGHVTLFKFQLPVSQPRAVAVSPQMKQSNMRLVIAQTAWAAPSQFGTKSGQLSCSLMSSWGCAVLLFV